MVLIVLLDAVVGVALWITGLILLIRYFRFAKTSTAGNRFAMTAFWRRLLVIALPAIVVWLIAHLLVDSYAMNFISLDALFGAGIAMTATSGARLAVRKKEQSP